MTIVRKINSWDEYYTALPDSVKEHLFLFNTDINDNLDRLYITAICPIHGLLPPILARTLLKSTLGCRYCRKGSTENKGTKSFKSQITEIKKIFPTLVFKPHNDFNLERYSTRATVFVTCSLHDPSIQYESDLKKLKKGYNPCFQCSEIKRLVRYQDQRGTTYESFIELAKQNNPLFDSFDLSRIDPVGFVPLKVEIGCKNHDETYFYTTSRYAFSIQGKGCWRCAQKARTIAPEFNTFRRRDYVDYCIETNEGYSCLYVMFFKNKQESFYKVGISKDPISRKMSIISQYGGIESLDGEIYLNIKAKAGFIWDLETKLHRLFKEFSYTPVKYFGGKTECFTNIDGILDHIPFDQVEVIIDLLSQQEIAA